MKYKFEKNNISWCVEEYNENDDLVKATYNDGNIVEAIYDNDNNYIKKIVNGVVVWEAKSKLETLIEHLEMFYDKVEYDERGETFTLTDNNEDDFEVFCNVLGRVVLETLKNPRIFIEAKALQLIEDYFKEER